MGSTNNTMFSVLLGFQFSDNEKTSYKSNPSLRLGISYFNGTTLAGNFYREDRKPYDTLASTNSGQMAYIDSIFSQNYFMIYSSEQLRFDGSFIFRTNPEARWSLFAGIGATIGLSINANTEILYNKSDRTETRLANGNNYSSYGNFSSNIYKSETFINNTVLGASTYIPMGIDFRIGKKKEFWKMTHLFYELRPNFNYSSIPELGSLTNAFIQHGLGLRVSWN
jgi:hypothetical protein